MSNTAYTATAFKPATPGTASSVLRELFQATPLYIFVNAAKAAFAKPAQR